MIPGVITAAAVALVITSLAQWRHRGGRPSGPVRLQGYARQRPSPQHRPAATRHRLRPVEERILAELDATWEPGYADRVAALLGPDADVDLPPS